MDGVAEGGIEGVAEAATGPAVSFPDAAVIAEVAAIEAPRPTEAVKFRWPLGVAYALAGGIGGGALFAGISYATSTQLGIVAIIIGVLSGLGAAKGGRSREAQIVGAATAAIGYFVGLMIVLIAVVGWNRFTALPPEVIGDVMWKLVQHTFSSADGLFLAIAVYQGWKIPRVRT